MSTSPPPSGSRRRAGAILEHLVGGDRRVHACDVGIGVEQIDRILAGRDDALVVGRREGRTVAAITSLVTATLLFSELREFVIRNERRFYHYAWQLRQLLPGRLR